MIETLKQDPLPLVADQYNEFARPLDYRQVIHDKCFQVMTLPERQMLRKMNRNNIILPKGNDKSLCMTLNYAIYNGKPYNCKRCGLELGPTREGYSYSTRPVKYLHFACSIAVMHYRKKQGEEVLSAIGKDAKETVLSLLDRFNFITDDVQFFFDFLATYGYEAKIVDDTNFVVKCLF